VALNIKDPGTARHAAEVARRAREPKTAAIRQALRDRKRRLILAQGGLGRGDRMVALMERRLWPRLPAGVRGRPLTNAEREAILGYDPHRA
jgi:antitoxin VapB